MYNIETEDNENLHCKNNYNEIKIYLLKLRVYIIIFSYYYYLNNM